MEVSLAGFRSAVGFELTDRGDRSTGTREFGKGDGESDSDLDTTLPPLLPLGVASDDLLEFSDKLDLSNSQHQSISDQQSIEMKAYSPR